MSPEPLVKSEDVTAAMPRPLTSNESGRMDVLIASASAAVRGFCRRDFAASTSTIRVKPLGDMAKLPNAPVTGIVEVKRVNFDGSTTAFAGWLWDGGQELHGLACIGSPMINAPEIWTEDPYTPMVEITYEHGYAEVPQVISDVVVGMIVRVLLAPSAVEGIRSETTGPYSYQSATPSPGVLPKLSDDDKQRLREAGYASSRSYTTVALR